MPAAQLADAIDQSHRALNVFLTGDPAPLKALYSRRDDITLANPFGPPVRGWSQVEQTLERAAELYRDGHATAFEDISLIESTDLAYIVEIERYEAKVAGASKLAPIAVRATTIFRREDGEWRVAHRHADPTVSPQPAEIILGQRRRPAPAPPEATPSEAVSRTKRLAAAFLVLAVLLALPAYAGATTYNVPDTIASDCSRDVTADLNSWLASVPNGTAADPSVVEFTEGTCYRIDGAIGAPNNGRDPAGYKRSYISLDGSGATVDGSTYSSSPTHQGIAFADSDHITIQNFTIKGANPNPCNLATPDGPCQSFSYPVGKGGWEFQSGIGLFGVDHVVIRNVDIESVYGDGVTVAEGGNFGTADYTPESTNVTVEDSTIDGTGRHGVSITTAEGVTVRNVTFDRISYHVFDLEPEIPTTTVSGITIDGNTIKRHWFGIVNGGTGACLPRRNWVISNNTMLTGGTGWNRPDLYLAYGDTTTSTCGIQNSGLTITGNTIPHGNNEGEAVWIEQWDNVTIDENRITQPRTDVAPVVLWAPVSGVSMTRNDWRENPWLYTYGPQFYTARNQIANEDPALSVSGCGNITSAGLKPMPCQ